MFRFITLSHKTLTRAIVSSLFGLSTLALNGPLAAQTPEDTQKTELRNPIDHIFTEAPDDHVLGAEDAPNTIIAYASVTCSHCGSWFTKEWPSIKSDLVETGKVRFIFREFPTPPVNMAMAGFFIANCAAHTDDKTPLDNAAFFKAIEYQMENQDKVFQSIKDGKVQDTYADIAKKFGMDDIDALNKCFSNQTHYRQIDRSVSRAQAGKVTGTPYFIINGEAYKGGQSSADFVKTIEKLEKNGVSTFDKSSLIKAKKQ